ncbi:MAG TPA: hypothetical protein VEV65_06715, partial [Kineosporiaceae bacterium]|nr:hypothetical protein [Kineosporiaceae bacterium]
MTSLDALRHHLDETPGEHTVVLGPTVDQTAAFRLAEEMRIRRPSLGIILVRQRLDSSLLAEAIRAGLRDVIGERDISKLHAAVRHSKDLYEQINRTGLGGGGGGRPR